MGKIQQNKQLKMEAIIAAARAIFLQEGYVSAGMDRIAADAGVTKQTVYRYFSSKELLFEEVLRSMGRGPSGDFLAALDHENVEAALLGFANAFIVSHLSEDHLAVQRLLIAERDSAPELLSRFGHVGPDRVETRLTQFFQDRLEMLEPEKWSLLWLGMLLGPRARILAGGPRPDAADMADHADRSVGFLLSAIAGMSR